MGLEIWAAQLEDIARKLRAYDGGVAEPPTEPPPGVDGAWDARLTERGVQRQRTNGAYDLVAAGYNDSSGAHHIYVDVLDENGIREVGAPFAVSWPDGRADLTVEAKPGEPYGGNFPMFASGNPYFLECAGWRIGGMGLGTIAEPHVGHHVSFAFVFRRRREVYG